MRRLAPLLVLFCACDPHKIEGTFDLSPRIACSGELITFTWNVTNIVDMQIIGTASGKVIVSGGSVFSGSATVDASDGKLDAIVRWKGDNKQYSAREKAPLLANTKLELLNEDHDQWLELGGPTENTVEVAPGAWVKIGVGEPCCPPNKCTYLPPVGICLGDTCATYKDATCGPEPVGNNPGCGFKTGNVEQRDLTSSLPQSTMTLASFIGPRALILTLENNSPGVLDAPAFGVTGLAPGQRVEFQAPYFKANAGVVTAHFAPPVQAVEDRERRTNYYTQSDPFTEDCKAIGPDKVAVVSGKSRLESRPLKGVRGLLRCTKNSYGTGSNPP